MLLKLPVYSYFSQKEVQKNLSRPLYQNIWKILKILGEFVFKSTWDSSWQNCPFLRLLCKFFQVSSSLSFQLNNFENICPVLSTVSKCCVEIGQERLC